MFPMDTEERDCAFKEYCAFSKVKERSTTWEDNMVRFGRLAFERESLISSNQV